MMQVQHLEFKIDQLRKDKMILSLMSINVFILSLFLALFLPQLLFQFVFASQNLTAEPPVLTYIPAAGFVIGVGFFIYAVVMILMKKMKIMQLETELSMMMTDDSCNCGCDCGDCSTEGHSHMGMSSMDDEMDNTMSTSKKKVVLKKKTTKKA
ncbi:MAG: hypothetical protein ABI425_00700 [Patescibacteria group bacterium]